MNWIQFIFTFTGAFEYLTFRYGKHRVEVEEHLTMSSLPPMMSELVIFFLMFSFGPFWMAYRLFFTTKRFFERHENRQAQ